LGGKLLDDRDGGRHAILVTPHVDAARGGSVYSIRPFIAPRESIPILVHGSTAGRVTVIDLLDINVLRKIQRHQLMQIR
jgi:hypothetical protein